MKPYIHIRSIFFARKLLYIFCKICIMAGLLVCSHFVLFCFGYLFVTWIEPFGHLWRMFTVVIHFIFWFIIWLTTDLSMNICIHLYLLFICILNVFGGISFFTHFTMLYSLEACRSWHIMLIYETHAKFIFKEECHCFHTNGSTSSVVVQVWARRIKRGAVGEDWALCFTSLVYSFWELKSREFFQWLRKKWMIN